MSNKMSKFALYQCPYCGEQTLVTNKSADTFTCFSCGKWGWISEVNKKVEARQTVQALAVGNSFYDICEQAAAFYYINLQKANDGSRYFKKRNITRAQIDEFGLGFAPDGFTNLYEKLRKEFSDEELLKSGLFKKSEKGKVYDFFRNRVIFPIFDEKSRVVAFGGRVLDDSKPKYLNSSENEFFSKRSLLYGFPYDEEQASDTIFICEGYMDLIAMKKAGIRDSAAVLGTALTDEHVKLIANRYKKVCIGLDSDAAGMNAIRRSLKALKRGGLMVTVPKFNPAKDPDEFLQRFGVKALCARLGKAEDANRFVAKYGSAKELLNVLIGNV